jgi:nitroreductase
MTLKDSNKSFYDCINERFSCRNFKEDKISTENVEEILKAANLAPTAKNIQPQRIYVVENEALLSKINPRYTFNAKTLFIICYDKSISYKRAIDEKEHGDIDCAIVATHMMLAATALNLGSCMVCSFDEAIIKAVLSIPADYVVSALIPVGYPEEIKEHNTRIDIEDFVIYK